MYRQADREAEIYSHTLMGCVKRIEEKIEERRAVSHLVAFSLPNCTP